MLLRLAGDLSPKAPLRCCPFPLRRSSSSTAARAPCLLLGVSLRAPSFPKRRFALSPAQAPSLTARRALLRGTARNVSSTKLHHLSFKRSVPGQGCGTRPPGTNRTLTREQLVPPATAGQSSFELGETARAPKETTVPNASAPQVKGTIQDVIAPFYPQDKARRSQRLKPPSFSPCFRLGAKAGRLPCTRCSHSFLPLLSSL